MKARRNRISTMAGLLALLAGCSSLPSSDNPAAWWHGLEGGVIAEQRPPPPGADQAYPNLASVPPRPPPPDRQRMGQISAALTEARANAQYAASAMPITPPQAGAAPAPPGATAQPPPPPAIASAPLASRTAQRPPAGSATGQAAAPPPAPPAGTGASASLAAATAPPTPPAAASAAAAAGNTALAPPPGAETAGPAAQETGLPPLPTEPPAPPRVPGAPGPTQPTPPPAAPAPAPAPAAPAHLVGEPLAVAFAARSAVLPAISADALRQFAKKRGTATIEVTGFGETASSDPLAQSAALGLGLNRAQAMAAILARAGVPAASIRIAATAAGRGGLARLIE